MRRREASNDKNWCPGNDAIPGLAASLDRIFKKVNSEGLSDEETLSAHKATRRIGFC